MLCFFPFLGMAQTPTKPKNLPKLTQDDSIFIQNVIKDRKPLTYTATPTYHGVVLVMVFKDYTLLETLVDGFVEDVAEITPKELVVYSRESE